MTRLRVLIAGCGYVGTRLGELLVARGHRVAGLRRDGSHLPAALERIDADLLDAASLRGLPCNLDAVFYTAAASGTDDADYHAAYDEGVARLLDALDGVGARPALFALASSVGVYAQDDGSYVDETSPATASGTQRHLLAGERRVAMHGAPAVVLRLSGIYGPGRMRLIDAVRAGTARYHDDPPLFTNRIHRDDAARALAHLLSLVSPPPLLIGTDDEAAPEEAVLSHVARLLGAPPPLRAGTVSPRGAGKRCRNDRLRASGFRLRYPTYREGYAAIIRPRAGR